MKKIISLLLASLLLVGCASTPKPEPTSTATPEPTVEPTSEVVENVTKGYVKLELDQTDFDINTFTYGFFFVNSTNPGDFCKYIEKDIEKDDSDYLHFINSEGEIKIVDGKESNAYDTKLALEQRKQFADSFVESVIETCPETIEIVKNYTE